MTQTFTKIFIGVLNVHLYNQIIDRLIWHVKHLLTKIQKKVIRVNSSFSVLHFFEDYICLLCNIQFLIVDVTSSEYRQCIYIRFLHRLRWFSKIHLTISNEDLFNTCWRLMRYYIGSHPKIKKSFESIMLANDWLLLFYIAMQHLMICQKAVP